MLQPEEVHGSAAITGAMIRRKMESKQAEGARAVHQHYCSAH
jgi:hypothetical protein